MNRIFKKIGSVMMLGGLVMLAACGGNDPVLPEVKPDPTPATPVTPTPDPTPTPTPDPTPTPAPDYHHPDNDAMAITRQLGWGWNLGNHFDTSSGEDGKKPEWGYWDNASPKPVLYQNLAKAGVKTVRIPVTWGCYIGEAPDYQINRNFLENQVAQNVFWAQAAGLNVILNLHHDEYWLDIKGAANDADTNARIKEKITAIWTQIADRFKNEGDYLFFESFNEVQDGSWGWGDNRTDGGKQYATLREWNQAAVDAIRATGSKNATRWISVPSYSASPTFALDDAAFALPNDAANHIMVSVHFYDPTNFTLTPNDKSGKSEWGHTADPKKAETWSNEQQVRDLFAQLKEKFIDNNIPCYIGEYGCVKHNSDRANLFRAYYLEYVSRAAYVYGLPMIIWDNNSTGSGNECHGFFNHSDGSWLNDSENLIKTLIRAVTSDEPDYTLESIYNKAP